MSRKWMRWRGVGISLKFFLHVFDSASELGPVGRGGGDGRQEHAISTSKLKGLKAERQRETRQKER